MRPLVFLNSLFLKISYYIGFKMSKITLEKIKKLPDLPGVYFFKDKRGRILYIGKATSLRDRVRSYLGKDILETRGQLIGKMIQVATAIDFEKTDSVLEALILEAHLIKKNQPPYNTDEKDDKSFNHVVITDERFPRVLVIRGKDLYSQDPKSYRSIYGPFPHGTSLREAMKIIRRIFPFRDKCTPVEELPKGKSPRPCFESHIGLCPGVCSGKISAAEYQKTVKNIELFFEGKKKTLLKKLEREMKEYAENREFEKAADVRKTIFSIKHIHDIALIKREKESFGSRVVFRIEAYDIAHLGGSSTVGVMTVVEDNEKKPSEYKRFRIRAALAKDDLSALTEVLERRLKHTEWQLPDVIVIDGGKTQRSTGERVVTSFGYSIPVLSVVKDDKHQAKEILGNYPLTDDLKRSILLANSESHRFAISYHKKLRRKNFL